MTEAELLEIRAKSQQLLEELQSRHPGQQVTRTEWMYAGGIQVSVTWPFDRQDVKRTE